MTTHHYNITIDSLRHIPGDVLVEHLGYALKTFKDPDTGVSPHVSLNEYVASGSDKVEYREYRTHPFDGPELFDDDFTDEADEETRKVRYTDGGPHEGVQYIDVSTYGDTETVLAPGVKFRGGVTVVDLSEEDKERMNQAISTEFPYAAAMPISLTERDKELLNRAIATDFPHLSALFQHKRDQA